jgi:glutamine amidotransferase
MIVIVDYGMGNLGSIANILRKVGADAVVTRDQSLIEKASKLILPGVGAFDEGMKNIRTLGLEGLLNRRALKDRVPTLGICLGMQLMARRSEEGSLEGLGWLAADVKRFRFPADRSDLKVPHMGWNTIKATKESMLLARYDEPPRFYFVHSYYVVCDNPGDILATASHGGEFTAAFQRDNLMGVQFHPEKSHKFGMALFGSFIDYF